MVVLNHLEPQRVFHFFEELCAIPHGSGNTKAVSDWLVDFAKARGLRYVQDQLNNVVIFQDAAPGYESAEPVILQGHMDMVCEKNSDVEFDFDNDPIRTRIDGEWVRAEGTTLGADCGIGMAAALAVMLDETVEHGPVEALFTVDEETGLTGAFELGEGMLTGKYLVNLDSEDEGEIFIGCAGGIDTIATFHYTMEPSPKNYTFFRVDVSDLQGGHSGDDIDKGRVNSNKTVARLLWDGMQSFELKLCYFNGGNLRNAIPREAYAIFGVPARFKEEFVKRYNLFAADLEAEFRFREPNFKITLNEMPHVDEVLDSRTQSALVYSLVGVPNGVVAMSFAVPGLVETSTNLAAAVVGRERQDLRDADGRVGLRAGGRRCGPFRRLSGLDARPAVEAAGGHRRCLQTAVRHRTQGPRHPCRAGVRSVPRKVSRSGDGLLRSDAPRRAFARRTARNRHGSQVLETADRSPENNLIPIPASPLRGRRNLSCPIPV